MHILNSFRTNILAASALMAASIMFSDAVHADSAESSSLSDERVREIVEEYILNNPEVLVRSLQAFQQRQIEEQEVAKREALEASKSYLLENPGTPVTGSSDPDSVTIVQFFDYQCGFCKKVHPDLKAVADSDPNIRLVWKEFPILGPMSDLAARAGLAVHKLKPESYLAYHDAIMGDRGQLTEEKIISALDDLGIDKEKAAQIMGSAEINDYIAANKAVAANLGIGGTPYFIIGDEVAPGAIGQDRIREMIAQARANK